MLGQRNEFFNQKRFWGWIANAIFHSLVRNSVKEQFSSCSALLTEFHSRQILFFAGMLAFRDDDVFTNGWSGGQWWVGTTIFTATLAAILYKGCLITE
jgi:phospholipid-transporting ATPase